MIFDDFPVDRESLPNVVGSEPSFNLTLRCGFPDSSKNMFNPMLLTVHVET
jgi:hypothetical protein